LRRRQIRRNYPLHGLLVQEERIHLMMIYREKISTPLASLSDDEQMKLVTEAIASESHWAKGLVGRIAVVIREIQQH
jgi:hypothetical protein